MKKVLESASKLYGGYKLALLPFYSIKISSNTFSSIIGKFLFCKKYKISQFLNRHIILRRIPYFLIVILVFLFGCVAKQRKTAPMEVVHIETEDGDLQEEESLTEIGSFADIQYEIEEMSISEGDQIIPDDVNAPPETQAAVVDTKLFNMGKSPSQTAIIKFRQNLDICFSQAARELNQQDYYEKGFNYMVMPMGVVNPFSKTQVQCITGSPYAENIGKDFCAKFFECVKTNYTQDN
jgi:hypothetical protein